MRIHRLGHLTAYAGVALGFISPMLLAQSSLPIAYSSPQNMTVRALNAHTIRLSNQGKVPLILFEFLL